MTADLMLSGSVSAGSSLRQIALLRALPLKLIGFSLKPAVNELSQSIIPMQKCS